MATAWDRASSPTSRACGNCQAFIMSTEPLPQPRSRHSRGAVAHADGGFDFPARPATHAVMRSSVVQRCPATRWKMRQSPTSWHSCSPLPGFPPPTAGGPGAFQLLGLPLGGLVISPGRFTAATRRAFGGSRPFPAHTVQVLVGPPSVPTASMDRSGVDTRGACLLALALGGFGLFFLLLRPPASQPEPRHFQHTGPSMFTPAGTGDLAPRELPWPAACAYPGASSVRLASSGTSSEWAISATASSASSTTARELEFMPAGE